MAYNITLSSSMRSNLLSLRNISTLMNKTQNILSTGKKVNSAIDNATSYYQARSLTNRASDLNSLLDSMSQGIQTIKAACEGIEAATAYLEQAKAYAEQSFLKIASIENSDTGEREEIISRPIEEFIAKGYTVVPTNADASDIESLIAGGATKLVLSGDVAISESLNIGTSDIVIEGNGHKLTYNSTGGDSTIVVNGSMASVEISNLIIEASGSNVRAIQVLNGGSAIINTTSYIKVSGTGAQVFQNGNDNLANLYEGQNNTQAIVNQLGADAKAAYATTQFYVGNKNGEFGQGKWYLPSIGELMELYGTDYNSMTEGIGVSGAIGENIDDINTTLAKLATDGIAEEMDGQYWSSSEYFSAYSWILSTSDGYRNYNRKDGLEGIQIRSFMHYENCFNPIDTNKPGIGDIMYLDGSWGNLDNYDSSKANRVAGVICGVGDDGSVTVVSLKDLRFTSSGDAGVFNPENPYNGSSTYIRWATKDNSKYLEDVTATTNYNATNLINAFKTTGSIAFIDNNDSADITENDIISDGDSQFLNILNNYDNMIKDASYQGVNLLTGGEMKVIFNETRTHSFTVNGEDICSDKLGLKTISWNNKSDIETTITEITSAIDKLRNLATELGNKYTIIQTRQTFTDALTDVLETGADNLVLADMNDASAEYLMLQTRQQLAINSLSLASQSASSILKLF